MIEKYEHRVQTLTHPWDGDIEDTRTRFVWFSLLIATLVILFFQTSTAQRVILVPDPNISDNPTANSKPNLTRAEKRFAEDYQEIIEKLEFLIRNHLEYFAEYKEFEGRKYQNLLLKTLINIEKGTYTIDVDRLSTDIEDLIVSLKSEEKILREDKSLRKLYKNVRTLRTDFQMIEDILLDDISLQLDEHKSALKDIKKYLEQERADFKSKEDYQISMYELQEQLHDELSLLAGKKESLQIILDGSKLKELIEAQKLQKELNEVLNFVYTIDLSDKNIKFVMPHDSLQTKSKFPGYTIIDKLPSVPPVPPVQTVPKVAELLNKKNEVYTYNQSYLKKTNGESLANSYNDTILVKSSRIPIYISNQIGDVEVKGWDKNTIVADYTYEVTSDSHKDAKEFLESISLGITTDVSGIHVTSVVPSIHNSNRQITNSFMILYVPNKNTLFINNSFGRTEVSDITNNVTLQTKNSNVFVSDINGNIASTSKNGIVSLTDINGAVEISSSRGTVVAERLNSNISIVNSHAPVTLVDCNGNANIENSGAISVNNHTGNLDILNDNGQTNVQTMTGNLLFRGSYKPLFVQGIDGSIKVENKNANISVSDISGETVIINESGMITAHNIDGRVDISNYGGQIFFVANNDLNDNSTIQSDYGLIDIVLPQQSNILLHASTEGGSIVNSYNTKVENSNFVSSTTIALGDKKNKLAVSGTNAKIIIKDTK